LAFTPPILVALFAHQWHRRQQRIRRELERMVAQRTAELEAARNQAELLATIDPLTAIHNRRGLFDFAQRDLDLARRRGSPFSVAIFDLDYFKRVNDNYGHVEGDRVLREVAFVARNAIRGTDLLGRIGGEEFMLVMPDTAPGDAYGVADRIRLAISDLVSAGNPPEPVTASFGVAGRVDVGRGSLEELQFAADTALYRAKRNGRNRVELGGRDVQEITADSTRP